MTSAIDTHADKANQEREIISSGSNETKGWVEHLRDYQQRGHLKGRRSFGDYYAKIQRFTRETGKTSFDEIVNNCKAMSNLQDFIEDVKRRYTRYPSGTVSNLLAILKTTLRACGVDVSKADFYHKNTVKYRPKAAVLEHAKKAIAAAEHIQDKLAFALIIEPGVRWFIPYSLTWGSVLDELQRGLRRFSIHIEPNEAKREIEHLMYIGTLSTRYLMALYNSYIQRGIQVKATDPVFSDYMVEDRIKPITSHAFWVRLNRIMISAGICGAPRRATNTVRYERNLHSFHRGFRVTMRHNIDEKDQEVIEFAMGHKIDTYGSWLDDPDGFTEIIGAAWDRIGLDDQVKTTEIQEFNTKTGQEFDPKAQPLFGVREIQPSSGILQPQLPSCSTVNGFMTLTPEYPIWFQTDTCSHRSEPLRNTPQQFGIDPQDPTFKVCVQVGNQMIPLSEGSKQWFKQFTGNVNECI